MRILFIADAPSQHTRRWVEHFRDCGYEVHVASFRKYTISGVSMYLLRTYGLGKLGYLINIFTLRALAKKINPDIIHAHHITSYGFIAAMANIKPLILTAWGSDVLVTPNKSQLLRWITSKALSSADAVTTVAEHMNASIIELGISPLKVHTIPFGVDIELFHTLRDPSSIPDKLRIISTRNFSPIYDIPTLIKALAVLRSRGFQFSVNLIGDGPLRSDIIQQITRLDLNEIIKLHGHVEHKELSQLLNESHIFVTTSLSDGNNVSLTEAMACGCFPVASNIPANRQWIQNEKNGYLFSTGNEISLADCLGKIIHNPRLMVSAFSINQTIVAEKANWKMSVKKMDELYRQVIKEA